MIEAIDVRLAVLNEMHREEMRERLKKFHLSWAEYLFLGPEPVDEEGFPITRYPAPFPLSLIQHFFPRATWGWKKKTYYNFFEREALMEGKSWPRYRSECLWEETWRALFKLIGRKAPPRRLAGYDREGNPIL